MDGLGWVIEKQLARSNRPGRWTHDKDPVPPEIVKNWITMVEARGIRSIICLLSPADIQCYYPGIDLIASYQARGFTVEHIPTRDRMNPPLTAEELERIWRAWEMLPKPVLVHCSAGIGRTGDAVDYIQDRMRLRPCQAFPIPLHNEKGSRMAMEYRNVINVIRPYLWNGVWVFDDPARGLDKEALISGMPEMIEAACARQGIANPGAGFVALFSDSPFPGADLILEHLRPDEYGAGNWYRLAGTEMEGWLCPALLKYFERPPGRIYIQLKPLNS